MSMLSLYYRCRAVVRSLVNRRGLDREMREEMDAHLAQAAARYAARGMAPREAQEAARREFGNVAVLQEEGRDARAGAWIESVIGDLRFALRQIARRPLASATIVAVLALGIGVHAGVYTMYNALHNKPPAGVRDRKTLVRLRGKEQSAERGQWMPRKFSYSEYRTFAERRDLFAAVTAWSEQGVTIDLGDAASAAGAKVVFIDGDYFEVAGVGMALGAALPISARADEGAGEMAAVISEAMWQNLFGGLPDVIGRSIRVNGTVVKIVGVASPLFKGLSGGGGNSKTLWMPLASRGAVLRTSSMALTQADSGLLNGAALLAPGVEMERASNAVKLLSDHAVARLTPTKDQRTLTADVVPFNGTTTLPEDPEGFVVSVLFAAVGILILVVACTNVSALVVGAGVTRSQEIAIRLSLGASRSRLVRQLLTESCVLALAGGVAGLTCYALLTRLVVAFASAGLDMSLDFRTAAYTMAVAITTGILFGLSPALHATRRGVSDALKGGGAGGASARSRLQSTFVVAQIAVTQPLLMGIGIVLSMLVYQTGQLSESSVGARVLHVQFDMEHATPEMHGRLRDAMGQLTTLPGVERVVRDANGAGTHRFTVHENSRGGLLRDETMALSVEGADSGYFAALDIPLVRGRETHPADTALAYMPIVIGSSVAHELWGGADPLGRRFRQSTGEKVERDAVVVGVYDDSRETTEGSARRVFAFDNDPRRDGEYLVRTSGPARPLVGMVRTHLRETVPSIPISSSTTIEENAEELRNAIRQVGTAAGVAGGLVLLLASIGLYGVIGLALAQRRREIGIRIALGAAPVAVVAMLYRQGLRLGVLGLILGLPFSVGVLLALTQLGAGASDIRSLHPALLGGIIASTVLAVASVAIWIPARRAAVVDPTLALRAE